MVYKKKRGRKKKRGPKKKKPQVQHVYVGLKRPYHIITSNNGVQLKDIYTAVDVQTALRKMKEIQEKLNSGVEFPVRFTCSREDKLFKPCDYRLILIKKTEPGDGSRNGMMRNEFGKFIECVTDNDNWVFVDELPYDVEETFWVYGFHPRCQRKTFSFIMSNLIEVNEGDRYYTKQIVVFRNKLLISSVDHLEMVICKNHQDSVRLYNAISEKVKKKHLKYVTFAGDVTKKSFSFNIWYDKIRELTNWTRRKILKNTTRD